MTGSASRRRRLTATVLAPLRFSTAIWTTFFPLARTKYSASSNPASTRPSWRRWKLVRPRRATTAPSRACSSTGWRRATRRSSPSAYTTPAPESSSSWTTAANTSSAVMPWSSSFCRSSTILSRGRAPPCTRASATPSTARIWGRIHVSARSRSSLGERSDSRLKVKNSSVWNSSGT